VLDVVDSVAVEPSRPPSVLVEAKSASKKESPSGQEITSSTARFRRNPAVLDALIHYKRTEAMVLSISWSKPDGWMLVDRAKERFS